MKRNVHLKAVRDVTRGPTVPFSILTFKNTFDFTTSSRKVRTPMLQHILFSLSFFYRSWSDARVGTLLDEILNKDGEHGASRGFECYRDTAEMLYVYVHENTTIFFTLRTSIEPPHHHDGVQREIDKTSTCVRYCKTEYTSKQH